MSHLILASSFFCSPSGLSAYASIITFDALTTKAPRAADCLSESWRTVSAISYNFTLFYTVARSTAVGCHFCSSSSKACPTYSIASSYTFLLTWSTWEGKGTKVCIRHQNISLATFHNARGSCSVSILVLLLFVAANPLSLVESDNCLRFSRVDVLGDVGVRLPSELCELSQYIHMYVCELHAPVIDSHYLVFLF